MIKICYERAGCIDVRYFKDNREFVNWLFMQHELNDVIDIKELEEF